MHIEACEQRFAKLLQNTNGIKLYYISLVLRLIKLRSSNDSSGL